jgi:hypothetical protein
VSPRAGLDTEITGKILFAPAEIEPRSHYEVQKQIQICGDQGGSAVYTSMVWIAGTLASYPVQDINVRVSTGLALGRSSSKGTYRT